MDKKQIVIIGAGGFGREVQWLLERLNKTGEAWSILGYIDDNLSIGTMINGYKVIGGIDMLLSLEEELFVCCAIGNSRVRRDVLERLSRKSNFVYPNLIDPSVYWAEYNSIGKGNIICAGNILTVNIQIGDFNIINLDCTVGHDVVIENFVTIYPSANISGNVKIRDCVEVGTGSQIIQGKSIGAETVLGAGAVVVSDLSESGVYVGVPVRKV